MTTTIGARPLDAARRGPRAVVRALQTGHAHPEHLARRRLARRIASYPAARGVGLIVR